MHRGDLTDANTVIGDPTLQQGWSLDATGNWVGFTQNDSADASNVLDQTRVHNEVNEVTDVWRSAGPAWATPAHDRNGNMTAIPQPLDLAETYDATWDAWNRLVKLVDTASSNTVAEYQYNGNNWRTVVKSYVGGVPSETRNFYYRAGWQCVEERVGSSSDANRQYIWGSRYVDDLILRDRDTTGSGTLNERLYALQDALFSIAALCDDAGGVLERCTYTPYGQPTFYNASYVAPHGTSNYAWDYLFTGRRLDVQTGLYLYRARYYHAEFGRFIGRDPIMYSGGINLYAYAVSNPITRTGPVRQLASDA